MREFASQIQSNQIADRPKKVLVVMNPVANKKRSEKFVSSWRILDKKPPNQPSIFSSRTTVSRFCI